MVWIVCWVCEDGWEWESVELDWFGEMWVGECGSGSG